MDDQIQPLKSVRMRLREEAKKMETLINIVFYGSMGVFLLAVVLKLIIK
jgi:hypothetical protein